MCFCSPFFVFVRTVDALYVARRGQSFTTTCQSLAVGGSIENLKYLGASTMGPGFDGLTLQ